MGKKTPVDYAPPVSSKGKFFRDERNVRTITMGNRVIEVEMIHHGYVYGREGIKFQLCYGAPTILRSGKPFPF